MNKFKPGDRVAFAATHTYYGSNVSENYGEFRFSNGCDVCYGTIKTYNDYIIEVDWDKTSYFYEYYKDYVKGLPSFSKLKQYLVPEEEMKEKYSSLEHEFNKLTTSLFEKMETAAALIREANKEANSCGYSLQNLSEVTDSLFDAIKESGWRTSSMSC